MVIKSIILTGQTNSGKSSLTLTLARFLGTNKFQVETQSSDRKRKHLKCNFTTAQQRFVSSQHYFTRGINIFLIDISKSIKWKLIDTTGLSNVIAPCEDLRIGMAMTIEILQKCDCIIHLLDTVQYTEGSFYEIDDALAGLHTKVNYIPVASKIDNVKANIGLINIKKVVEEPIPCSTITGEGIVNLRQELLKRLK